MSMSVGSSSDALSYIQSLLQSLANTAGNVAGVGSIGDMFAGASTDGASGSPTQSGTSTSAFGPAPPPFQNGTMAALIALQGQNTTGAGGAQSLFGKLDSDGDGAVSKSEFEGALGQSGVDTSSADALFSKLDRNGDGSIDQGELTSATKRGHGRHHNGMAAAGTGGGDGGSADSLLNATGADGAKTQTATNADGSSTTTISYADGSTVTLTTPAAPTGGASTDSGSSTQAAAKSGGINLIEQLIKMQAQLGSQQGTTVSALA